MFHWSAAFFYYESCLSESSFEATVLLCLLQTEEVSFKYVLFPYRKCIISLDISCLLDILRANV